jgi:hypothetical protein
MIADMSAKIELECTYCGKIFLRRSGAVKSRLKNEADPKFYCSLRCAATTGTSVTVPCANCRTMVTKTRSTVTRSKTGHLFCSRSCSVTWTNRNSKKKERHPKWNGGKSSYRFGRELQQCEECGDNRYYLLTVHHKDGDRTNNKAANLEDLCNNCHTTRHLAVRDGRLVVRWGVLTSPEAKLLMTGVRISPLRPSFTERDL